jgi:hypothetical protein
VRTPTIITGVNDGGKSTALRALDFLLGGSAPDSADFSILRSGEEGIETRSDRIEVTGSFSLDDEGAKVLGVEKAFTLRRVAKADDSSCYELRTQAPVDPKLRDLETMGLSKLKDLASEYDVAPDGPQTAKASWRNPLQKYAASLEHEEAWVVAAPVIIDRLPKVMMFSSTAEPDPEGQIRAALKTAFTELLDQDELVGTVRAAEKTVREKLAEKAEDLCEHVASRCPELDSFTIVPEVTFTEGFRSVQVLTARGEGGAEIALNKSGAGQRRRINLAIWEWTGNLIGDREPDDRAVVIAYDEPDTHLDYARQRELVTLIQKQCAKPGVRMVVATHSLNLIDRVDIEDVVHLRLEDDRTVVERLAGSGHEEIDRYLAGVSEAMGLRNSVLLHERCFLGVEGPTEVQAVPILFRLATGMSLQSAGIALIAGNGNIGALRVVRFLKDHRRQMAFIVVDADSSDNKLFGEERLRAEGVTDEEFFFVGARELEDVFSDQRWAATANKHWPRDDGNVWKPGQFATMRGSAKFSKAIENSIRGASSKAPAGKPGYLISLVQDIEKKDEMPKELVELFSKLAAASAA